MMNFTYENWQGILRFGGKMTGILLKNIRKLNKLLVDESISSVSIVSVDVGKTKESCVNLTRKSVLRAPKNFTKILRWRIFATENRCDSLMIRASRSSRHQTTNAAQWNAMYGYLNALCLYRRDKNSADFPITSLDFIGFSDDTPITVIK